MDYEKMYEAALKTATQWIKDGYSDKEKICLESIFPELRESEDERIRKTLIEALKTSKTVGELKFIFPEPTREECIAYLEKQKECVADSSKTSANEDESIRKFLVDYFTSYKIGNVATKLNGVRIDDILNYLEKQKETLHILEMCKENANSFTDGIIEVRSFQRGIEEGRRLEKKKLDKMIVVSPEVWDNAISDAYENGKKEGEKQKEQKHPDGCFTCDEYKKGYEEGRRNGFTAGYNKAMKEVEQKEQKPVVTLGETYHVDTLGTQQVIAGKMPQKPAEWDDYTKTNLGRAIQIIKDARGTLHGYQTDDGIYECDKAIEALEHFLYRGLEIEKSAEWSEEDEKRFKRVLEIVDRHGTVPVFDGKVEKRFNAEYIWLKNLRERLKSFRPQSKQKQNDYITPHKEFFKFIYDRLINVHKENPNVDYMRSFKERLNNLSFGEKQEWSEEDEKILNDVIEHLKVAWCGCSWLPETLIWLKSLRPSWKPSEHQMNILKAVKDYVGKGSGYWGEGLGSLIEDLEKLR